ncbi:unnamed protein product [Pieris brassicae]|uniref:Uncharacterized protein n=1 Tax=Pieris brassicae TaxID=7116 RepID=A0A9P0T7P3_PIEBR|nr:unnamed protein product [Pieris brassicae]
MITCDTTDILRLNPISLKDYICRCSVPPLQSPPYTEGQCREAKETGPPPLCPERPAPDSPQEAFPHLSAFYELIGRGAPTDHHPVPGVPPDGPFPLPHR